MRENRWIGALAGAALLTCLPVFAEELVVLGIDEDGEAIEAIVDEHAYLGNLAKVQSTVRDSALVALARKAESKSQWKLQTAVFGIGASFEAGLGPIIKVKATPRFRLAFSNAADPALP